MYCSKYGHTFDTSKSIQIYLSMNKSVITSAHEIGALMGEMLMDGLCLIDQNNFKKKNHFA